MNTLVQSTVKLLRRSLSGMLLASAFLATMQANADSAPFQEQGSDQINAINSAGYGLDPGFNGGKYYLDRFAGPTTSDYRGRKVARLANGDMVSVGLVPRYQQGNQADGYYNIGIVRYSAAGVRQAWVYPSPYGNFDNNYLIYPGAQTTGQLTPRFSAVKDVKVAGNRIYIMVDHSPVGGSRNVHLLIFSDEAGETGRFLGHYNLFTDAFNEDGAALAITNSLTGGNKLTAVATVYGGSGNYIIARRFNVGGAVTFEGDSSFGTNGTTTVFLRQDAGGCAAAVAVAGACPIIATSLDVGWRGISAGGPYYIGADRLFNTGTGSNDWDGMVIKLTANGVLDTSFGGNGIATMAFDFGNKEDRVRSVAVRTTGLGLPTLPYNDEVYATLYVAQACAAATAVVKLNANGAPVTAFGTSGRVRFGGWNNPDDAQACAVYGDAQAWDTALDGSSLIIVGQGDAEISGSFERAPAFTALDTSTGAILQRLTTPISITTNSFPGAGSLYSVVANGNGDFSVVGDTRDPANGNRLLFATARIGRDSIFANGFD